MSFIVFRSRFDLPALVLMALASGCGRSASPSVVVEQSTPHTHEPNDQTSTGAMDALMKVRNLTPTHCEAPKALLFGDDDYLLSRPQLSPVSVNGRVVGFRHDSISSHSVYARCGIRSGDVWTTVNGVTLDSPDKALELYPRLRESEHLNIALLRGNEPVEVQIDLR